MPPRTVAPDSMPDFAGYSVGGNDGKRYELQERLGSGAYGKVYRALDTQDALHCAVKILCRYPDGSKKAETQKREFVLQQMVGKHKNIVNLFEWFSNPNYVFVILELCGGGDLFAAITEKRWYQDRPERIKATYLQILDGVQHCHNLHIFHRDIKPENILCTLDMTVVRLADFGLSTKNRFSQEFGCGSSYYMSPECIGSPQRGSVKNKSKDQPPMYSTEYNDIWALGIILTNLVTGRNPWRYATLEDGCFAAFMKDPNFLKSALPISTGMNSILKRVFKLEAEKRLTIRELRFYVSTLESIYTAGHPILEPPPPPQPVIRERTAYTRAWDPPISPKGVGSPWSPYDVTFAAETSRWDGPTLDGRRSPSPAEIRNGRRPFNKERRKSNPAERSDFYDLESHFPRSLEELDRLSAEAAAQRMGIVRTPLTPARVPGSPRNPLADSSGVAAYPFPGQLPRSIPRPTEASLAPPANSESDSTGSGGSSAPKTPESKAINPPYDMSAGDESHFRLNDPANPFIQEVLPQASPTPKRKTKLGTNILSLLGVTLSNHPKR